MLKAKQEALVRAIVTDACVEMLSTYGLPPARVQAGRSEGFGEHDIAGLIGFTGRARGSMILVASSKIFTTTFPTPFGEQEGPPSMGDLFDWAGEMANQTLGRIKRRFCELGLDLESSTPTTLHGRAIGARPTARDGIIDLALSTGAERISVRFEIVPPADGELFKPGAEPIACSDEGEMTLF
jgi:CheY-specific phosphatase CheX